MKFKGFFSLFALMLLALPVSVAAAEADFEDPIIFGLEVEKLLFFVSAHLALALAVLTLIAYIRTKKSRLIFITAAFFLFSAKLFLLSLELFIDEIAWIDIVAAFFDFAILLAFFYGVIKK